MVDCVLMHARAVSDDFPHFAPNASQKTRSAGTRFVSRIVGKDAAQIAIIDGRQIEIVALALALVVFPERCLQHGERFNLRSRSVLRFCPRQLSHNLVDILQLPERWPTPVATPPARPWCQPDSKALGKVFRRVRLRIPRPQMQNVVATPWFWLVKVRILFREGTIQLAPAPLEMQAKSRVERVARFMTQNAQAFRIGAAFDLEHLFAFKLHQARMCEVERNSDAGNAVGREPFFRQPDVRLEANAAGVQLVVETFDMRLEERSSDLDRQIADAHVEQLL